MDINQLVNQAIRKNDLAVENNKTSIAEIGEQWLVIVGGWKNFEVEIININDNYVTIENLETGVIDEHPVEDVSFVDMLNDGNNEDGESELSFY